MSRRYWIHSAPDDYTEDGQRECARGDRCSAPRLSDESGRTVRLPALTYQAFCPQDRNAISKALNDLPELFVRVHQRLDKTFQAVAGGPIVAVSKTAPVPLSLAADELLRLILATLVSWEERVRTVARLKPLDTATSRRRRDGVVFSQSWTILAAHLDALLALGAEPMLRDGEFVDLDGADAGLDLLDLAHRCRRFLTDTKQPSRHLSGVYCDCGYPELFELLDDDGQPAGARCRQCRAEYDAEQYTDLTRARVEPVKSYRRRPLQPAGRDDHTSRRA
ncbi:hypothetical protein [Nonomuraea wenchangensis]|uniref:Uncharacterized protein n=1 Tax=Nonomuraea wenchangensis TaxID=568860 RepID=A0A1I0EY58_9ACTN|nr:hypothetical protein [Nonomuraea wenchangensis]SET49881.1 hypothetical protein SAMN05421811_103233 [Nonomuraea wenchangensis]